MDKAHKSNALMGQTTTDTVSILMMRYVLLAYSSRVLLAVYMISVVANILLVAL